MSKQTEEMLDRDASQEQADSEELVLPDESDRIIDDLKAQLRSLQGELDAFRAKDSPPAEATGMPPAKPSGAGRRLISGTLGEWDATFAPRIASRLQRPTEDLATRLERLIEQVQDPELRQELERCQQTAFYLFDTFRQISENHRALMDSLAERQEMLKPEVFRLALHRALAVWGEPVTVEIAAELPAGGPELPRSVLIVVRTLARVARQLIGEVKGVRIAPGEPGSAEGALAITIACSGSRDGPEHFESPSQVVFKPGVSAVTVVDWLYMEKIVELQGGSLALHHEAGRTAGFCIALPAAVSVE